MNIQAVSYTHLYGVIKHFPGHGATSGDTHEGYAYVGKTLDEMLDNEMYPFAQAIDKGVAFIMVGHISAPEIIGDDTPSSLSSVMTVSYTHLVWAADVEFSLQFNYKERLWYKKLAAVNSLFIYRLYESLLFLYICLLFIRFFRLLFAGKKRVEKNSMVLQQHDDQLIACAVDGTMGISKSVW